MARTIEEINADIARNTENAERREQKIRDCEHGVDDCAMSSWASDIVARQLQAEKNLAERGNVDEFDILTDLNGNEVKARIVNTKFNSLAWMLLDDDGQMTGQFLPFTSADEMTKRKTTNLEKRGFRVTTGIRPAKIKMIAGGDYIGAPQWPTVVRSDI